MLSAKELLIALSFKYKGDWDLIYEAIANKEKDGIEKFEEKIRTMPYKAVTILDDEYPQILKQIFKPPFVIYYYGNISLLNNVDNLLAVVGSREPTKYGECVTKEIVKNVCKQYTIVSGMARGVDGLAHISAIENGGKTVAVLGSGIDNCYPMDNKQLYERLKKEYLVISEYPESVPPSKENFPSRNRIIAGLCKGTLLTEAKIRSGSSITAHYAVDFGRIIMAVPTYANEGSFCNQLIRNGASLVENGAMVLEEMEGYPTFQKNS